MSYRIRIYDNYHYQDEDEAYDLGETFATRDAAISKAREIVDSCLAEVAEPGRSADDIYGS